MKLIYTSYSPNTRDEDIKLNWQLARSPSSWIKGNGDEEIAEWFMHKYDSKLVIPYNYARSAMYDFFLNIKPQLGSKRTVLYQGFTCIAAVNPALWAGYDAKYVDIEEGRLVPSLEQYKNAMTDDVGVVVVQYTLGQSPDIEGIVQIANDRSIVVLEDCTHTIGGRVSDKSSSSNAAVLLGTLGDAAVFSIGRDKAVSGVDGGILILNNDKFVDAMSSGDEIFPVDNKWVFRELYFPIFWFWYKRSASVSRKFANFKHLVATKLRLLSKATTVEEKSGMRPDNVPAGMPNAMAKLGLNQLKDIDEINSHRVMIAALYTNEFAKYDLPEVQILEAEKGHPPLRLPLLVESRDELLKYMDRLGIVLGDWYSDPISPKDANPDAVGYIKGTCQNAESMTKRVINLPTHINIGKVDVERIVKEVAGFYR